MSMLNSDDGFDDPLDFNLIQLQKIDEHLRCPICKELLNATMMLNTCSHSFCALCIRRSLNTEQLCPKCRKSAYESNLIHNYDLDNVVNTWKESRKLLLQLDKLNSNGQQPTSVHELQPSSKESDASLYPPFTIVVDDDDTDDFIPNSPKKYVSSSTTPTRRSTRLRKQTDMNDPDSNAEVDPQTPETQNSQDSNAVINSQISKLHVSHSETKQLESLGNKPQTSQLYTYQRSTSQPTNQYMQNNSTPLQSSSNESQFQYDPSINYSLQPQEQQQTNTHELKTTTMVECPICSQHMKYNVLDRHIDRCLQGDSRIPPDPPQPSSSSHPLSNNLALASNPSNSKMKVPSILKRQQQQQQQQKMKPIDLGKKPVKLVYSMMSDKELRDCLRSLNLPDHGDKAQKIWRHKEYINLYNANYDSQHPVSAQVLIQRLQAIENSQLAGKANQLKRKVTDLESHKTKYADHFANLIASAKKSKTSK